MQHLQTAATDTDRPSYGSQIMSKSSEGSVDWHCKVGFGRQKKKRRRSSMRYRGRSYSLDRGHSRSEPGYPKWYVWQSLRKCACSARKNTLSLLLLLLQMLLLFLLSLFRVVMFQYILKNACLVIKSLMIFKTHIRHWPPCKNAFVGQYIECIGERKVQRFRRNSNANV